MRFAEILGVDPDTVDLKGLRRAYAPLLKQHRPDQDPEGFRRLRDAFEEGQRYIAYRDAAGGRAQHTDDTVEDPTDNTEPAAAALIPAISPGKSPATPETAASEPPPHAREQAAAAETQQCAPVVERNARAATTPTADATNVGSPPNADHQTVTTTVRRLADVADDHAHAFADRAAAVAALANLARHHPSTWVPWETSALAILAANERLVVECEPIPIVDLITAADAGAGEALVRYARCLHAHQHLDQLSRLAEHMIAADLPLGRAPVASIIGDLANWIAPCHPSAASVLLERLHPTMSWEHSFIDATIELAIATGDDLADHWPYAMRVRFARLIACPDAQPDTNDGADQAILDALERVNPSSLVGSLLEQKRPDILDRLNRRRRSGNTRRFITPVLIFVVLLIVSMVHSCSNGGVG